MYKKVMLLAFLMALAPLARAEMSQVWVMPNEVTAGDFTTALAVTDPGDNTLPWIAKDLSATVAVLGNVAGNTATAVVFSMMVPDNYSNNAALYAIVKPAASDTTVKLKADVQVQKNYMANPTTSTAVTVGSESAVLTAAGLDNLTRLRLPNTALATVKKNERLNVYVGRSSGTGENLYIHGFVLEYKSTYFGHR